MKKRIYSIGLVLGIIGLFCGCKTSKLEVGGVYAPTNELGKVVYNDTGLALADASYKLAYQSTLSILKFERDNRQIIWDLNPSIKQELDKLRKQMLYVDLAWVKARRAYKANPTPAGLSAIQTALLEMGRVLSTMQTIIEPAKQAITRPPTPQ